MPRASRSSKGAPFAVGLDIVEVERVRKAARSARFLKRVFSKDEIAYCMGRKSPWQHFAVRFAAKEAVFKALGMKGVSLLHISVARDANGRPSVLVAGKPEPGIALSLTHSDHYAAAVAVRWA
ncbi:MAG: holo-ACP synthase [Elusimicrobia bacterium]|nr:holo-ACP synthase [Elusimicrobiota bacterium]